MFTLRSGLLTKNFLAEERFPQQQWKLNEKCLGQKLCLNLRFWDSEVEDAEADKKHWVRTCRFMSADLVDKSKQIVLSISPDYKVHSVFVGRC